MSYVKKIVCLANSKMNGGRCVAGREVDGDSWVRPVSSRNTREISDDERTYVDGQESEVLDIIEITMIEPAPKDHHVEDHLIDTGSKWEKIGTASWGKAVSFVESLTGSLWINEYSSTHGENDRIPWSSAETLSSSIILIKPSNLIVVVLEEYSKQVVRAKFSVGDANYCFKVTDPKVEECFIKQDNGTYKIENAIICVSLTAKPWRGYGYKIVAAIITPDMKF